MNLLNPIKSSKIIFLQCESFIMESQITRSVLFYFSLDEGRGNSYRWLERTQTSLPHRLKYDKQNMIEQTSLSEDFLWIQIRSVGGNLPRALDRFENFAKNSLGSFERSQSNSSKSKSIGGGRAVFFSRIEFISRQNFLRIFSFMV